MPLLYAALPDGVRLRMIAKAELFLRSDLGPRDVTRVIPIVCTDRSQRLLLSASKKPHGDIRKGTFVWLPPRRHTQQDRRT